jgi:hypothetical protein
MPLILSFLTIILPRSITHPGLSNARSVLGLNFREGKTTFIQNYPAPEENKGNVSPQFPGSLLLMYPDSIV